jgi:hypothetical protein
MTMHGLLTRFITLALALAVAGCTGLRPLPAPDESVQEITTLPGYPNVRTWGDAAGAGAGDRLATLAQQLATRIEVEGKQPNEGRFDSLVLSGGGSDGPFGAGLLVGWTKAGTRPEFSIVTGISAGALIAPFAFLGPEYDDELRRFTVENSTETLLSTSLFSAIFDGLGLFDNSKLNLVLRGLVTPEVVQRIAEEHRKGRRLLIGTTNLDAQRPMIWSLGDIAVAGLDEPERTADLITKIMIASASIPGAFPPQLFTVVADGLAYSEMHVDGGVTKQLFFLPTGFELDALPPDLDALVRRGTVYVVRNSKLGPDFQTVPPGLVQITSRAISTLIKFGGRNDIALLRQQAVESGFGIKVIAVPESFDVPEQEFFDPVYMQALFAVGQDLGGREDAWLINIPPSGAADGAQAAAAAGRSGQPASPQ